MDFKKNFAFTNLNNLEDYMCITLGIHIGHDGGAAIMDGGKVVVASSEERYTRYKYANGWWNSLRICLNHSKMKLSDMDRIIISNAGEPLQENYDAGLSKWSDKSLSICTVDHHLSHAFIAYAMSGFEKALVFVADAGGNNNDTQSAFVFDNNKWDYIMQTSPDIEKYKSLGTTYEAFTNFLGFRDQESGKTMALAGYGDKSRWNNKLFKVLPNGEIISDLRASHYWGISDWASRNSLNLGEPFPDSHKQIAKDIASYIQSNFEDALLESIDTLVKASGIKNVVISGGIGLNCAANTNLRYHRQDLNFYFCPACSDVGLPLGNAIYGQWMIESQIPNLTGQSLFLGPSYNSDEVSIALKRHPDTVQPGNIRLGNLEYYESNNPEMDAAKLISEGNIIGWWQGRSEFGPRALGARSILANPQMFDVRNRVNEKIKEREWFRPFGPSILESHVNKYIIQPRNYRYMIEAPLTTKEGKNALGDCIHVDGSARIQTVEMGETAFAKLLNNVYKLTGYAAVLNTSFNINEPIVETPGDAIATFLRSNLDALVLDRFICFRNKCIS
jgi:carbamoyltransferase